MYKKTTLISYDVLQTQVQRIAIHLNQRCATPTLSCRSVQAACIRSLVLEAESLFEARRERRRYCASAT